MGHPLFDGIREFYSDEATKPISAVISSNAAAAENQNIRNSKNAVE